MLAYAQNTFDDYLELVPNRAAIGSVIWLHGLGANGNDFVPIVDEFELPEDLPLRFIFPHAPMRPVTLNNGHVMRAWFDIHSLNFDAQIDHAGVMASIKIVENYVLQEIAAGGETHKIILAGFSQGAAIALMTGIHFSKELAGIIALSGCLPQAGSLVKETTPRFPIFMAHGTEDNIVPFSLGLKTADAFKKLQFSVDWHAYQMSHSVCQEEIEDIKKWLFLIFKKSLA